MTDIKNTGITRGTTPDFLLTVRGWNLTDKSVYVTINQDDATIITKTNKDLDIVYENDVTSIYVTLSQEDTLAGGNDKEDDETYRARIREYGLASVSTGPARQYESQAKAVSSIIFDAKAVNLGAGEVGVYLLLSDPDSAAGIISDVEAALSADDVRPLTDDVTVALVKLLRCITTVTNA